MPMITRAMSEEVKVKPGLWVFRLLPNIFGYLDIWIFGYLDIWIFGYLDIWIFGYLDIWIFGSQLYHMTN